MCLIMPKHVEFTTSDNIKIVGDLYPGANQKFAILLHMRPSTKEGWKVFATKLVEKGMTVLAIDQRGHGESTMDGALNYENFTEEQSRAKILDVEAAFEYLKTMGATEESTVVIGGSIGANLAIQFLQMHSAMKKAVALSPGLNFCGITTEDKVAKLQDRQKVLVVVSDDDQYTDHNVAEKLKAIKPECVETLLLHGLGHAEKMFDVDPSLMDRIIVWVSIN